MKIELKRGEFTAAADTLGGELVSFRDGEGTEYIWQGDKSSWTGQNPCLFPIVGNLKDGKIKVDGEVYEMARHGFARRSEFDLAERGEDWAALELRQSPETLGRYPFDFLFRVEHRLTDKGFSTAFVVRNPGERDLLFCVGAHTGINCPLGAGERFEDYRLVFDQAETVKPLIPTERGLLRAGRFGPALEDTDTLALDHRIFDEMDTLIFEGLRSKGVTLRHRDGGRGVRMSFEEFPMIAFWTQPRANAPYICLEPWHGCAAYEDEDGEFSGKAHVIRLAPGEEKRLAYAVELC